MASRCPDDIFLHMTDASGLTNVSIALADFFTLSSAILHLGFLVLEMFLWTKPIGRKIFRTTPEFAEASKALAMNQGLYNGFLAAGLTWGLLLRSYGDNVKIFFLSCVVIAGFFGAATVSRRILFIQALPAAIALVLLGMGK